MPRHRIPLDYTNEKKLALVDEFLDLIEVNGTANRTAFAKSAGVPRPTLLTWQRKRNLHVLACANGRAKSLTIGGSGCISKSDVIEEDVIVWVKEQRRDELPVSRETIVLKATALLPSFLGSKTPEAKMAWCDRFMQRHGLSIRMITHSGRKTNDQLNEIKNEFVAEVSSILMTHFLDSSTRLPPPYVLYNMDQTSVYCNLGAKTTVEFVGAKRVPCKVAGKGGYRCTVALTVCADGRILAPHFVFKGEPGCDVEEEVMAYCSPSVATMAVQANACFDEVVVPDWIEQVWKHEVTGPTVLILDSLRIHKLASVQNALTDLGTYPVYVPGGATNVAQPLDVGIMGPFKRKLRELYVLRHPNGVTPKKAYKRRKDMLERTVASVKTIKADYVHNAFFKSGPFIPMGPSHHQDP